MIQSGKLKLQQQQLRPELLNNLKQLTMIPGEYIIADGSIECNKRKSTLKIMVVNTGDRPVQIGSHFHFFETNKQLQFNREAAFGMRLNIAAGTAVRFEPGEEHEVELVEYGGNKKVYGFNNLTNGDLSSEERKSKALIKTYLNQYKNNNE